MLSTRLRRVSAPMFRHFSWRAWLNSRTFCGLTSLASTALCKASYKCSMGLQSGESGGWYRAWICSYSKKSRTTLARWTGTLSSWLCKLSWKCCLANGMKFWSKMSRYNTPVRFRSWTTKSEAPPWWNAPQTWTEPPPPVWLNIAQSLRNASPRNRLTITRPSTRWSRKRDPSPNTTWRQWWTVRLRCCLAKRRRSSFWQAVSLGFLTGLLAR